MTGKFLYILRHAKSDHNSDAASDKERPLNKRGENSCLIMAKYINENNIKPNQVLCSDAVRTKQTIEKIMLAAPFEATIDFMKELYLASPGEILKQIAKVSNDVNSILIVGHNPGLYQLSSFLLKSGSAEDIENLKTNFPTAAFACFSLDIDNWLNIGPASGNLDSYVFPKKLEEC